MIQRPATAFEVAIVGAGPIGLELAVALKQLGISYVHIDGAQIGETIYQYPRGVRFFSSPERIGIAGVPFLTLHQEKGSREEYLAYLRGVVEQFDLHVHTYRRVIEIEPASEGFTLHAVATTSEQEERELFSARRLVLAIGDMHNPRPLDIPGEDLPHVSHFFGEPHRFFRRDLLIVGGRNSAVETALRCFRAGARVTISYRNSKFDERRVKYWLLPDLMNQIRKKSIRFHPSTLPVEIAPGSTTLEHVETGERQTIDADFVLALTGYEQDTTLFEQLGIELVGDNRRPQIDPDTMETNVPGVYVAGTAVAGTQHRFELFIENSHPHVGRIVHALTGRPCPFPTGDSSAPPELLES